jgi:hypothetical protein
MCDEEGTRHIEIQPFIFKDQIVCAMVHPPSSSILSINKSSFFVVGMPYARVRR